MKIIKKIIIFLFTLFSFTILTSKVKALSYEETTQDYFKYNINNFSIDGDYIIINGWALTVYHQHFYNNSTHSYSLLLVDKNTLVEKEYSGELKNVNKTELMKVHDYNSLCSGFYKNNCYYEYQNVGFEFKIPTKDLVADNEYSIKLRVYEKSINKGYQISIYVMGIDDTVIKDGISYQLYSDIHKTSVTVNETILFVRTGPSQRYAQATGSKYCSISGYRMYWQPYGTFTNIKGAEQNNPNNIDSELWVNIRFNEGSCYSGMLRAINGTNRDGWTPWVYLTGSGDPAIIKTSRINSFDINEIKAYTSEKGSTAKAVLTVSSTSSAKLNIKAYLNNNLVYESKVINTGTMSYIINYLLSEKGILKVVVSDNSQSKEISSSVYTSSENSYEVDENTSKITIDNPILVTKEYGKDEVKYYETIELSANPYNSNISQGRSISGVTSSVIYYYPLEEFALNDDYIVYALYESEENTQNYEIVDGNVKVDLVKDVIIRNNNYDKSNFYEPNTMLSVFNGNLYSNNVSGKVFIDGGNNWYPSWNENIGTHYYYYIGSYLGVNKVTIKRKLSYTIINTMFGQSNGKYQIKRVKNPDSLNVIYNKTFKLNELKEYVSGL